MQLLSYDLKQPFLSVMAVFLLSKNEFYNLEVL